MRRVALGLVCVAALNSAARAQQVALEALTDVEASKTDAGSLLLARNGGRAVFESRLHGFLLWRLPGSFEALAVGVATYGTDEDEGYASLELLELRYQASRALMVEGGRLLSPVGAFGARHFSDANPLIGSPDLYPPMYPWGAVLSGAIGAFDYRAGLVSLPVINEKYSPEPSHRPRPVAGVGLTAGPAFRIGVSATQGSYLHERLQDTMPAGRPWHDYRQTVVASDVRLSVGYVEVRAEFAWSSYEVPTVADDVSGWGAYAETRLTLSPRWFAALRLEYFDYPFILPINQFFWVGTTTLQENAELGVGFRPSAHSTIKLSYRRDHWPNEPNPGGPATPDGYAIALQGSMRVDVLGLLTSNY